MTQGAQRKMWAFQRMMQSYTRRNINIYKIKPTPQPLANSDFGARKTDSLDEGSLCNEEDGNNRQRYHQ
jgi:hypothetical protein